MRWLLSMLSLGILLSCEPQPFYEEKIELGTDGWATETPLSFKTEIQDTAIIYNLELVIEHTPDYRYQNIYLNIKTLFPHQDSREERLSIDLADKKGKWIGKCNSKSCKCKVYLLDNFKFPTPGNYGFELSQDTREETLTNIRSLTLQLFNSTPD